MAKVARLTKQMPPWMGTETQDEAVRNAAIQRGVWIADVTREAVDCYFGLVNGERQRSVDTTADAE